MTVQQSSWKTEINGLFFTSTVGIYYSKSFVLIYISNKFVFRTPIDGSLWLRFAYPSRKVSPLQFKMNISVSVSSRSSSCKRYFGHIYGVAKLTSGQQCKVLYNELMRHSSPSLDSPGTETVVNQED